MFKSSDCADAAVTCRTWCRALSGDATLAWPKFSPILDGCSSSAGPGGSLGHTALAADLLRGFKF